MMSLITKGKNKFVHLTLKKSLSDLWPVEFDINRRKWDVESLSLFKNCNRNGVLDDHVAAQFGCAPLVAQLIPRKTVDDNISPLEDLRRIVKSIFSTSKISMDVMVIYSPDSPLPVFHLLVHLPIRFPPQDYPLLLVSVFDFQIMKQLAEQDNSEAEQLQLDYECIIKPEFDVHEIEAHSTETIPLLRYLLRLNSTKIKPSTWQLENLRLRKNSPWMCSFISPLYAEHLVNCCDLFWMKMNDIQQKSMQKQLPSVPITDQLPEEMEEKETNSRPCCTSCSVENVNLRFCALCKVTGYCSAECQRKDWNRHKPQCVLLRPNQPLSV